MEQENFDFYQEALKAFDAPVPQPKKEEPEQETAAEVTEPAAPEKPKRKFNPWWAVALCAILCLALVIGFGGGEEPIRGEHYIYGMVLESGEGYVTLTTANGIWHVELEGANKSAASFDVDTCLWVFYNGEPERADQDRYANKITENLWKITASFWKTDAELYTAQDEIQFDLDADGRKEIWSLEYVRSLQGSLQGTSFSHQVRLTAKDARGNVLQDVYLISPEAMSMAFHNAEGQLSLVLYNSGVYEVMDLRMEEGKLAVYRNGKKQKLFAATDVQQTEPPITEPVQTTPSVPPQTTYTIQFELADRQATGSIPTQMKNLTENEAVGLKNMLDALLWTDGIDKIYNTMCRFTLTVGNQAYTYTFSHDGLMRFGGKYTRIGTAMLKTLLELMPYEQPAEDTYFACLENGDRVRLGFEADGTASIITSDYASTYNQRFAGRYATFGSCYLLALGDDLRQILVLQSQEHRLEYVPAMSSQTIFQAGSGVTFFQEGHGGVLFAALRHGNGYWSMNATGVTLSMPQLWQLRQSLAECDWKQVQDYSQDDMVALFHVYDGVGDDLSNPVTYYMLAGGRILRTATEPGQKDAVARVDQTLWFILMACFERSSEPISGTYAGTNQDGMAIALELMDNGQYDLSAQMNANLVNGSGGNYIRIGNVVVLYGWQDGPTYVHLDLVSDKLVYNEGYSVPNEGFSKTTAVTLTDLRAATYVLAGITHDLHGSAVGGHYHFSDPSVGLSDEMAKSLSLLLNTLQWKEQQAEPDGILMGYISLPNVDRMYGSIEVFSGMRLAYAGYEAQLTKRQWEVVWMVMTQTGTAINETNVAIVDGQTYQLWLNEKKQVVLYPDGKTDERIWGMYTLIEDRFLFCYGDDGQVFVLQRGEEGWCLLPGYNGIESLDISDGTLFFEPIVDIMPEESTPAS